MAWLEENSQDFIRFKIDLLDEEAQGDPLKRTELVRSVVKSIAEVPDELKRTVYVQESARRLGMQVDDLLSELGRQARNLLEKKAKAPLPSLAPKTTPFSAPRLIGRVGRGGVRWICFACFCSTAAITSPWRCRPRSSRSRPKRTGTHLNRPPKRGFRNRPRSRSPSEVLIELDNMAVAIRHPVVDGVLRHFREQMGDGHIPGLEDCLFRDRGVRRWRLSPSRNSNE